MKRLFWVLACIVLAISLTACTLVSKPNEEPENNAYRTVYAHYLAYSEEKGESALSYEEWLFSIRGDDGLDGKDGTTPHIGENGNWWIGDVDTLVPARGSDGQNGADGKDGHDGIGIVDIKKISSDGLVDTYEITYTDGTKTTFTVTNGTNGTDGKDGVDGVPGKDGQDGVTPTIEISEDGYWIINGVKTEYKAIGTDGQDGQDGEPGKDGEDGKDGVDGTDGKDGEDGKDGIDGAPGKDGVDGEDGQDGTDGVGIASTTMDANGNIVITYTDGTVEVIEHNWTYAYTLKAATCSETGMDLYNCTDCSLVRMVATNMLPHDELEAVVKNRVEPTCIAEGSYDNVIYCSACGKELYRETFTLEKIDHQFVDGVCVVCGKVGASEGLAYTLSGDATYYSVSGIGTCTDTDVVIPGTYNGLPVKAIINNAFENTSITSITIYSNLTTICSDAFLYCNNLTAVYITDLRAWCNIEFQNSCANPLYFAHNLYLNGELVTDLVIPEGVAVINSRAFLFSNINSVIIPDGVLRIEEAAFSNCTQLVRIDLGNTIQTIQDYAFSSCSSLTSLNIPESMIEIKSKAFGSCYALYVVRNNSQHFDLTIGGNGPANQAVMLIDKGVTTYANYGSTYTLTDDGFLFKFKDGTYSLMAYCGESNIVTLPKRINESKYNIYMIKGVINVTIPKELGVINDYAFDNAESLKCIVIEDGITKIGRNAFSSCDNLTEVNIPESVTAFDVYAFQSCKTLKSITLPSSITGIEGFVFDGCIALETINIPESVTFIGAQAFYDCYSLTDIYIPKNVSNIQRYAFSNCQELVNIIVDPKNKYYKSIDGNLYNFSGTTLIQYASGKTAKQFIIPDGVTKIDNYAFSYQKELADIVIPNSVTTIGFAAFSNNSLVNVYYIGNAEEWTNISIDSYDNSKLTNATRYYYSETEPTDSGRYWHYVDGEIVEW